MSKKQYERVIIGIDPGTNILGFGIIGIEKKQAHLIDLGVLNLSKLENHVLKLERIFKETTLLIEKYLPDEMAVEAPFFGKNVQSMLKLGRAQGVVFAAALNKGLTVNEYSPRKVKQSVTGSGNAAKEQVAAMVATIVKKPLQEKFLDATDALAVAICHFNQNSRMGEKKSFNSWKAFVTANPQRKK